MPEISDCANACKAGDFISTHVEDDKQLLPGCVIVDDGLTE